MPSRCKSPCRPIIVERKVAAAVSEVRATGKPLRPPIDHGQPKVETRRVTARV
jgi:hypothetical protein